MKKNRHLSDNSPPAAGTSRLAMAALLALSLSGSSAMAANILDNPGQEDSIAPTDFVGWTAYGRDADGGWRPYDLNTNPSLSRTGDNAFKVFAGWNGNPNFNGIYQDKGCLPTATFSAEGWMLTPETLVTPADNISGLEGPPLTGTTAWLEVTFRDASETILAHFRSEIFDQDSGVDTFVQLPINQEIDLSTGNVTGTVTSLVAPTGTTFVRYQVVLRQSDDTAFGAVYVDDMVLDQTGGPVAVAPEISNVTPESMLLIDPTGGIQFDATAPGGSPIEDSGIVVTVNGTDVSDSLVITGTPTDKRVVYDALVPNTVYAVSIVVTDTIGLSDSATIDFDTYQPLLVWEAEHFNFNDGQFYDDPAPWDYQGTVGTQNVDENETNGEGDRLYRDNDPIATTASGDIPRDYFVSEMETDYKVGWYNAGEWVNYTRTFPTGKYNIYGRLSGGGGPATLNMERVTSDPTVSGQTTEPLGQFIFTARGWNTYDYVPLTDAFQNLVAVDLDGETTLRTVSNGGADMNFFMLLEAVTGPPAITNVFPNGQDPFQQATELTFDVASDNATIPDSGIRVTLNDADATGLLQITGTPTSKSVTLPALLPNALYTALIEVTDANSETSSISIQFDTFVQTHFMVESEDYDFNGGMFIDNPVPTTGPAANSYREKQGTPDIDLGNVNAHGDKLYRPLDEMATTTAGDFVRQKFEDASTPEVEVLDYKVGWFDGGEWVNYTRTYPTGAFRIYGRLSGNPGSDYSLHLEKVTGGEGTTSQTTERLGSFAGTGKGWGSYEWIELTDATLGTPMTLQLNGQETLRLVTEGNNDPNYFMLVPGSTAPLELTVRTDATDVHLDFPTGNGVGYEILYKDNLEDAQWTLLTTEIGDGTVMTVSEPLPGDERYYVLSTP